MESYRNARDVLPERLLRAVQEYLEGETVYIPVRGKRRPWGAKSGARAAIQARNREIRRKYKAGASIEELANEYFLSVETLRKLVRGCGGRKEV